MALNPMKLMKLKERFGLFREDHPKVLPFFKKLRSEALQEGSVLEMKVTTPDGKEYSSNIRLNAHDVETIRMFLQ